MCPCVNVAYYFSAIKINGTLESFVQSYQLEDYSAGPEFNEYLENKLSQDVEAIKYDKIECESRNGPSRVSLSLTAVYFDCFLSIQTSTDFQVTTLFV